MAPEKYKNIQVLTAVPADQLGITMTYITAATGLQCVSCHQVHGTGSTLGPDLSQIGKKYTRAQILESILEPSRSIEPKYVSYVVETADGRAYTGLLAERTAREVVLRTAEPVRTLAVSPLTKPLRL